MNIIFDLGGVVLEWRPRDLVQAIFTDRELQARAWEGILQHPDWAEYDRGSFDRAEAIQRFSTHSGLTPEHTARILDAVPASLELKQETIVLMQKLHTRGLPLYCLSNLNYQTSTYIQQHYHFWSLFSGIVISCHVNKIKPEESIYRHLLDQYNLQPQACLFIDDTMINLTAAARLGIHTLHFLDAATCSMEIEQVLATHSSGEVKQ